MMKKTLLSFPILAILFLSSICTLEAQILIKDINPGPSGSTIQFAEIVGSKLYFIANDPGLELWVSDRETGSTYMIGPELPEVDGTPNSESHFMAFKDDLLVFSTRIENNFKDMNLYVTNGSIEGTQFIKALLNGRNILDELIEYNNKFYFAGWDAEHGAELWRSDGTPSGTHHLLLPVSGERIYHPKNFTVYNNNLWFSSFSDLWKLDSEGELHKVADSSVDGTTYLELFTSTDAEPAYFVQAYNSPDFKRLVQINPDASIEEVSPEVANRTRILAYANQKLTFSEVNTESYPYTNHIRSLNASTGTISPLTSISTTNIYNGNAGWVAGNDNVFFTLFDGTPLTTLWTSDGTTAGTAKIDLMAGATRQIINFLPDTENGRYAGASGNIFFNASINSSDFHLWKSDGSEAGTGRMEVDGQPLKYSIDSKYLSYANGRIFFATHPDYGKELFYSDGTNDGTKLLVDLVPGTDDAFSYMLGIINDTLFLASNLSTDYGTELYALPLCEYLTCVPTGVKDNKVLSGLSIYPNPTRSSIYTSSTSDLGKVELRIYSSSGRLLKQQQIEINTGDGNLIHEFSSNPQGLYFVHITKDGKTLLSTKVLMVGN